MDGRRSDRQPWPIPGCSSAGAQILSDRLPERDQCSSNQTPRLTSCSPRPSSLDEPCVESAICAGAHEPSRLWGFSAGTNDFWKRSRNYEHPGTDSARDSRMVVAKQVDQSAQSRGNVLTLHAVANAISSATKACR